jgi:hypothetical protein
VVLDVVGLIVVVTGGDRGAVVVDVVVVGSLQPNQPGVLQLVVVVVSEVLVFAVIVVVLSRQPHHPGVLQVEVLVLVEDVVGVEVVVVVESELLLSKYFQISQSTHSLSETHLGTVSYFSMTSEITELIRWVPTPTLQPRSWTVSYTHL